MIIAKMHVDVFKEKVGSMPAAASDGKGYLVVADHDDTLRGLVLDDKGNLLGHPLVVCDPKHGGASQAAAVYDAPKGKYYVAWKSGQGMIRGALVDRAGPGLPTSGTLLDGSPSPTTWNHHPAACFRGMTMVAWVGAAAIPHDVSCVHVDASGALLDPTPLDVMGSKGMSAGPPAVAALHGDLFLVAAGVNHGRPVVASALVHGATVSSGPLAPGGPPGQSNPTACGATFAPGGPFPRPFGQALLVWSDLGTSALRGARVDANGKLLDANGFDIAPGGGAGLPGQGFAAVACDGKRYLVAWQKGSDIQATYVEPSGQVGVVGGTKLCTATASHLAAASNGQTFLVVWETGWAVVS